MNADRKIRKEKPLTKEQFRKMMMDKALELAEEKGITLLEASRQLAWDIEERIDKNRFKGSTDADE